jgi:hypothetical protein
VNDRQIIQFANKKKITMRFVAASTDFHRASDAVATPFAVAHWLLIAPPSRTFSSSDEDLFACHSGATQRLL